MNFSENEKLPPSAQMIADVIGREATLTLGDKTPYRNKNRLVVYVPKVIKPEHWIYRAIGSELAKKLSWHFSGEWLNLPRCAEIKKAQRNALVVKMLKEGRSRAVIARAVKLSPPAIYYIERKAIESGLIEGKRSA